MTLKIYMFDKPLFVFQGTPPPATWQEQTLVIKYSGSSDWTGIIYLLKHNLLASICIWFEKEAFQDEVEHFFVTMDAAGGLVKNHHGKILCIKRMGRWDLPKGKVENGEDLASCAVREVEEECGIENPAIIRPLGKTMHAYEHHDAYVLKTTHWFEMHMKETSSSPRPQEEEQITEVKWADQQELPSIIASTYPSIRDVFDLVQKK